MQDTLSTVFALLSMLSNYSMIFILPLIGFIKFIQTKREFFLIPIFIYLLFYYSYSYADSFSFMLSYSAVQIVFGGLIFSFLVLGIFKKLYFSTIIILLIVFRLVGIPILLNYFESYINTMASEKYSSGTHYYFRGIDLDVREKYRAKHATFLKDDKHYHWSFKANDFVVDK